MEDCAIKCSLCSRSYNKERKVISLVNCGHIVCSCCLEEIRQKKQCGLCKANFIDFNLSNNHLIQLYNRLCFLSAIGPYAKLQMYYCVNCAELILEFDRHQKLHADHEIISFDQLKEKISTLKNDFYSKITKTNNVTEYIATVKKKLLNEEFKCKLYKHLTDGVVSQMIDCFADIQKEKVLMKIKNSICGIEEKIISNNLNNRHIFDDYTGLLYQSYKYIVNVKEKSIKKLVTYIKNTKKIIVYSFEENISEIFEISELPFKFFKLSHSIEYHSSSKSVFISGGKQDNFIYSDASKITWMFNLNKKSLTKLFETPVGISQHRAVFVHNFYYIIGGYDYTDYFNQIYKINMNPITNYEIKQSCRMNIPRSSFGVAVVDQSIIYVFFGESYGKYLNSIEIINTNKQSNFSILIEIKKDSLRLKDIGVCYKDSLSSFLIIGGQISDNNQNHKLFKIEIENFSVTEKQGGKLIVDNHFVSLGQEYNEICGLLSNDRISEDDTQIFLYDSKFDK